MVSNLLVYFVALIYLQYINGKKVTVIKTTNRTGKAILSC